MEQKLHGTTIIGILRKGNLVIGGDGQVTNGTNIFKSRSRKIRKLYHGEVVIGFAGSTGDAFTLFELFESKLAKYKGDLKKSAVALAKEWRASVNLRGLDAVLIVGNKSDLLVITGIGDVVEPDGDIATIGSGGYYARAAAIALAENSNLSNKEIVEKSLNIAADICIYTNHNLVIEEL